LDKQARFGLLRHGLTVWNRERRIQGQGDSPLCQEGEAQVRGWVPRLKAFPWSRILSSDLGRATRTAAILKEGLGLPGSADARLREEDWGDWAGKTPRDLMREFPDGLAPVAGEGWEFRPPAGESRREVWERSAEALREAARTWPGETILVVTHEGVIRCLLNRLSGRGYLPGDVLPVRSYALHWLAIDSGSLSLEAANALDLEGRP